MSKLFLVRLFIFILLISGIFFVFYKVKPIPKPDIENISTTQEIVDIRKPPEGMLEYHNTTYHFSLFYPDHLSVNERLEGEGAITITFQNIQGGQGFQIFIIPYSKSQVDEERFKKDIPSGTRTDLVDVEVDGAVGASFYSMDSFLGETKEIWFVKNNFLYEVTTLKSLDNWLSQIIQTWEFI